MISVGGSFGVVVPYNNTYIKLNNLFFLGGDTLRGFAVAGVGPRDAGTADSLGGQYFYTTTTELSFPLYGIPKELGLLGKVFVDTGSLWGNQAEGFGASVLDSQLMRVGTGFGVQWISPFGPIRVDYSFPIVQESWDKTQNFRFSFGTRF